MYILMDMYLHIYSIRIYVFDLYIDKLGTIKLLGASEDFPSVNNSRHKMI